MRTCYLLTFVLLPLILGAQNPTYLPPKFQNITLEDGLSNLSVQDICQDELGYIWVATSRGLNKFDGTTFKQFYFQDDSSSLYHNAIYSLHKLKNGNILIGTSSGLNIYDYQLDVIKRVNSENVGYIEFCEYDNEIYCNGSNAFLYVYDTKTNSAKSFEPFPNRDAVKSLISIENHGLWGLNENSNIIYSYKPEQDIYKKYYLPGEVSTKSGGALLKLGNYVLIGTNQLLLFDLIHEEFIDIPNKWSKLKDIKNNPINFLSEVNEGIVWIGSGTNGLYIFDLNNNSYTQFKKSDKHHSLSSNYLTGVFKDKDNNTWIGTFDNGLEVSFQKRKNFNFDLQLNDLTVDKFITTISYDKKQTYFIGTRYDGLLTYNSGIKVVGKNSVVNSDNSIIQSNHIRSTHFDKKGNLWFSTDEGHYLLNGKSSNPRTIDLPAPTNGIVCYSETDRNMLAGTDDHGILVYNLDGELLDQIDTLGVNITQIIHTGSDTFTISSYGIGLFEYNLNARKMIYDYDSIYGKNRNIFNEVITCYKDSKGLLWVGNFKYGLYKIDLLKKDTLEIYTTQNGLPSNDITGIVEDNLGSMWISTAFGLVQLDQAGNFTNYSFNEGLENVQFHQKAALIDHHGTVFFGGNFGLTFFNASNLSQGEEDVPEVVFESLKILNQDITPNDNTKILQRNINLAESITLNHQHQTFSIDYKGLDFIAAKNLNYAYMLEGYDESWNYVDNRTFAGYTNLDPGTYTFKVKVQSKNGVWSDPPKTLTLNIKPAPWKSWWAYVLYIIGAASIIYISFQLVLKVKLYKKEIEVEHNERLREKEISKMKIRFFTNISHEFRTPLTLIKGNLDYLISDLSNRKISLPSTDGLKNSTDRLLRLVNQLLSFRQLESDTLTLEIREEEVVKITKKLLDSFFFTSAISNIKINLDTNFDQLVVPLDSDKYEKILTNLVSNALKFSKKDGTIVVKIEKVSIEDLKNRFELKQNIKNYLEVSIRDHGKGIPADRINTIFDRFTHYDSENKRDYSGSGIGLNFTKRLIELHGGAIDVTCSKSIGTCFSFVLPIDKKSYSSDVWHKKKLESEIEYHIPAANGIENEIPIKSKATILLIEDDVELNHFIKSALCDKYKVICAFDGEEGLLLARNHTPSLIISDIMMPKKDGISLCHAIREDNIISHIPIILLSAKGEEENLIMGYKHGADDYITKPFGLEVLISRIKNLLDQRKNLMAYYKKALPIEQSTAYVNEFEITFMKRINSILEEKYATAEFNVNQLAEEMNMSRTNFYRKFLSVTEISPKEYITRYRINKSVEMIQKGVESFGDISYQCGFSSQSIFSVTFKKVKGISPLQYKKSIINA